MHTFIKTVYDFHADDIAKYLDGYEIELAVHVGPVGSTFVKKIHYLPLSQKYRVRVFHNHMWVCEYSTLKATDAFEKYNAYQVENYPEK